MQPSLDDVRGEPAEIHDRLLALPADDYERRSALKDRQIEARLQEIFRQVRSSR